MLAVFPQFLRPEYGPTWVQAVVLETIIALVGDQARTWLETRPKVSAGVGRAIGVLMMVVAVLSVFTDWRST
ncbi:MAG: hypothetical protein WBV82_28790 [Myxococcaceae bacterium]